MIHSPACETARMRGHVVAMGGGGFLAGNDKSPLDALLLELSGRTRPHVVFLPTATGDSALAAEMFAGAGSRRA